MSTSAESLNALGIDLKEQGRHRDAEQAYQAATEADPSWSVPWYNLGLLYKESGRWPESVRCNRRAVELDPEDGAAWWNLGIAATALADWAAAREAWQQCGINLPAGADEPRLNFGPVPIRLNPNSDGEVVWCDRIDPARAIIRNIPLPTSGFREGDLLLHDGAPNGHRMWNGREYPVFDALQLLLPSTRNTFEVSVLAPGQDAVAILEDLADGAGIPMEDWETINWICKQCSEGTPHAEHDRTPGPWQTERRMGFSAESEAELRQLLERWTAAVPGARVLGIRGGTSA